jgi:hypothetical protein
MEQYVSWDILLLFSFLASSFFYGVFFGRARLLATPPGLYFGIVLAGVSEAFLPALPGGMIWIPLAVFGIASYAAYSIMHRVLLRNRRLGDEGWWQVFLLSFVSMGLVISFIARNIPVEAQNKFTEINYWLVISDKAFAVWLILSLVAMAIAGRRVE